MVELQLDGSFKQLGAVLDMIGHHVTQFKIANDTLAECIRRVRPRMASSELKCMPWSMTQYRQLDNAIGG